MLHSNQQPFDGRQLCATVDPELFFPEDYDDRAAVAKAKEVCNKCPLLSACLHYAVMNISLEGVWGATTPRERRNLRRRKRDVYVRSAR